MNLRSRRVVGQAVIRCQLTDGPLSPDQSDCGQLSQLETGFRAIWRSDRSERNDDAPIRHHPATTHRLGCRDKVTTLIKSINDQSRPIKTLEEEAVEICWQRPESRSKWMNPLFVKTLFSSPVQSIFFRFFAPKIKRVLNRIWSRYNFCWILFDMSAFWRTLLLSLVVEIGRVSRPPAACLRRYRGYFSTSSQYSVKLLYSWKISYSQQKKCLPFHPFPLIAISSRWPDIALLKWTCRHLHFEKIVTKTHTHTYV